VKQIPKGKNFNIVLLYTGAFLEIVFQSLFGFVFDNRLITVFGSSNSRIAYTGKNDIGRSVAQLSLLSLSADPKVLVSVPEHVRISGSSHLHGSKAYRRKFTSKPDSDLRRISRSKRTEKETEAGRREREIA